MEVHKNRFAVLSDLDGDCYDDLSSLVAKAATKPEKATEKQKQQKNHNRKVASTVSAANGFPSRPAPHFPHVLRPTERGRGTAWNNDRWIGGRSNTGFVASGKEETGTSSATKSGSSTCRSMTNRNAGDFPENKDINQADCEDNKLTFAEYEKSIQEKKKEATEAIKTEKRKVTAENQFEGMNLIGKKKEDDLHANMQKSGRNKGKRDGFEKKEKTMVYKTFSIGDIQIPIKNETGYRGGRRGGRGGNYCPRGRGRRVAVPGSHDDVDFPLLLPAADIVAKF